MLETELKSILTKDVYEKIEKTFDWDWVKEQVNYYYMDPAFTLRQNGIMVRIRKKDNKYAIQVKHHKGPRGALQICEENEYVTDSVPEVIDEKTAEKITGMKVGEIGLLGSLTTLRHSLMWDEHTEICLDMSTYFDKTDYEIEVEYTQTMPEELLDKLKQCGVRFDEQSVGKSTRFFKAWLYT